MKKDNKPKQSLKKVLSNNWFILKLSFQAAPFFMCFMIFDVIKQQALVFLEHTYGIQYVLEAAEFGKPFSAVLRFLGIVMAAWAVSFIIGGIYQNRVSLKAMPKIEKKLKDMMYAKVKELDLECYDNPEFYDEFVLSISEAEKSILRTHQILESFFAGLTALITRGVFFLSADALSFVFVLASFGLTFLFSQIRNKVIFQNRVEKNSPERKRAYVHRVFYLHDYAKEIRLNRKITKRLYEEFDSTNQQIGNIERKYAKKRSVLNFVVNYLTNDFISDVIYITYLVFRAAVQHVISYSNVVVLWNTSGGLKHSLREITKVFPQLSENSLYIEKIRNFLRYDQKISSKSNLPVPQARGVLELKDVSFRYSEKDGYILKNINLTIHPEEKVALVGYNGAGKTTLIKLIMRLYDPNEGQILYNGVDIRDYDVNGYREHIGTIFQDFKIFAATVGENVVLDEDEAAVEKKYKPAVLQALDYSGFTDKLGKLPQGLATELTTEFEKDGIDLSGGESQKLAIARAFYKDARIVILDEPSSALDPIAEYQLNRTMLQAAEGKSVVFISHRLSTTRHANRIFMMEHGRLIEEGTHDELVSLKGKYAAMWKAQAGKYI
ncbi:MAG: ABC transporter ATP-binding protein [Thermoclostridium sp.]|nr:ABC transporter ATP-binding protein [Thermoclostridium sp.]